MKLKINKVNYEGEGLTSINGKTTFVKGAFLGEEVEARLIQENKRYDVYETIELISSPLKRVKPFCKIASKCGGCSFAGLQYHEGLRMKELGLNDLFKHNGFDVNVRIHENINELGYRNKIKLHVCDGVLGYYGENTHNFVSLDDNCYIASSEIQEVISLWNSNILSDGEVTIRSNNKGELLIIFNSSDKPVIDSLKHNKNIEGIVWNNKCIYLNDYFYEERNGLKYMVHYDAFFQVNPYISNEIVKFVLNNVSSNDIIYDLYCGVGFFSLELARIVKEVIGIEEVENAIRDAKENAGINNLFNIKFYVGKVENVIPSIKIKGNKVLVDPPRSGLHQSVIETLNNYDFESIIYVSCNPLTLVRDLKKLSKYELKSIDAFDMFSYSSHMECVAILERIL